MKIKQRALALILSAIMVLTFMPAMAFAGDGEGDGEGPNWMAYPVTSEVSLNESGEATLAVDVDYADYDVDDFSYEWRYDGEAIGTDSSITVEETGGYVCTVYNSAANDSIAITFTVYPFDYEESDNWYIDYETSEILLVNEKATISVDIDEADGFTGSYSYIWGKWSDEEEEYIPISGANGMTLNVSSAGDYQCTVTESTTGESKTVRFVVNTWIAYPKADWIEMLLGGTATLELAFEGVVPEDLTYQWYVANDNAEDEELLEETSDTCTVEDAGNYYCRVYYGSGEVGYVDVYFHVEQLEKSWRALPKNDTDQVLLKVGKTALLEVVLEGVDDESKISYQWFKAVYDEENEHNEQISGATESSYTVAESGTYLCEVSKEGEEESETVWFYVYNEEIEENGVCYYLVDNQSVAVWANEDKVRGSVVVRPSVKFSDGKTYPVTVIDSFQNCTGMTSVTLPSTLTTISSDAFSNTGLKSITVPASVSYIGEHALGYNVNYSDAGSHYTTVPGFTIFGKTGSAAQTYAKANGFTFRDLAAEQAAAAKAKADADAKAKEALRQGTSDSSLPKVKLNKPAAKKTSITVKWKKLTKKQLKKSKATHYEIWVSENSAYPAGATTKEIILKKGKSKWTCKGLTKNKKYFVRIRAIKYVGGVKHVGPWKQRTIKTKKK